MVSASSSASSVPAQRPSQSRNDTARSSSAPRPKDDKRRAANLLRDYYGLSSDPASTPQSPPIASNDAVTSETHDLQSLLRSNSLSVLLGRESELIVQIRELDGERQSLVYNHHHELVAASDTIRNMKIRSESLEPSLDSLKSSFETMSNLASHLEVLRKPPSQSAIEPASSGGIDLLHDLELIVMLPTTLSDLIDCRLNTSLKNDSIEQEFKPRKAGLAQAEHLWGTMEPVLAAWTDAGVAGVREIAAECRSLLKEGRKTIEAIGSTSSPRP
ncbi:uncharacterized protein MEPE_05464 [Melanopsichium pennsylvanicum]|uniref:Vacuolar protein sorting-associated protein 51 homolog n=2 Tax=Melanopsichium pennsylvanicum TaxID=63383 RepID=A0AAJ4XQQ0_9BASI|nr:conserved hypothetical protein [Melanopsichium pennsylvanicum 4]SNX86755.1 uncharacterized protein MEPE_05464 [Melanopsichium pennsylvanicum]